MLTPPDDVPQEKLDVLVELLSYTRAHIVKVEPRHDEIVGAISHLPHVIAVALVNQISSYNDDNPLYRTLVAGASGILPVSHPATRSFGGTFY